MNINLNIIFVRHATSCANLINKGLGDRLKTGQFAPDSDICKMGIYECLQLSDFLTCTKNLRSDYINSKAFGLRESSESYSQPITLFCCSELRRSAQTLFVSFIKYLPEYLQNFKILILPWLNESKTKIGIDKDNVPGTLAEAKKNWKRFMKNIERYFQNDTFKKDLGNGDADFKKYLDAFGDKKEWDDFFELSKIIYSDTTNQPFRQEGRYPEIMKKDVTNFFDILPSIIFNYLLNKKKNGKSIITTNNNEYYDVNLVMVGHSKSGKEIIGTKFPFFQNGLLKQQIVNCEIIKLPEIGYKNGKQTTIRGGNFKDSRLFPVGLYGRYIKNKVKISKTFDERQRNVYRYYVFYSSQFNMFYSLYQIIEQVFYGLGDEKTNNVAIAQTNQFQYLNDNKIAAEPIKIVKISTPLKKFLNMQYTELLQELKSVIKNLERLKNFYDQGVSNEGVSGTYFYNFDNLLEIAKKTQAALDQTTKKIMEVLGKSSNPILLKEKLVNSGDPENKAIVNAINSKTLSERNKNILSIKDVFGLKNLHKYFFDGCGDRLKYLCSKCEVTNGKIDEFTLKSFGMTQKPFFT